MERLTVLLLAERHASSFYISRSRRAVLAKSIGFSVKVIGYGYLGDCWRTVNVAVQLHLETGRPVGIYTIIHRATGPVSVRSLLVEVIDQLDLPYVPELIDDEYCLKNEFSCSSFPTYYAYDLPLTSYFPTKQKRFLHLNRTFSYQIYGKSNPRQQNFSRSLAIQMVLRLQSFGFREHQAGLPLSIKQSVDLMCHSDFHIGINSAMSLVAQSVGLPLYVYQGTLRREDIRHWQTTSTNIFSSLDELEFMLKRDYLVFNQIYESEFQRLSGFVNKHKGEEAWVFGSGPSLDSFDFNRAGSLRLCINDSFSVVPKPSYFFAYDQPVVDIKFPAKSGVSRFEWPMDCKAVLPAEWASSRSRGKIPFLAVVVYTKAQGDFAALDFSPEELASRNILFGRSGTLNIVIHFCKLIGVSKINLVGCDGFGGHAKCLNIGSYHDPAHSLIRSHAIEELKALKLPYEFH